MARPLLLVTLAFFCGLALGSLVNVPLIVPFAGALLPGLLFLALQRRVPRHPPTRGLLLMLAMALSLGLLRYEWTESVTLDRAETLLSVSGGRSVTVSGTVDGAVYDASRSIRFVVRNPEVETDGQRIPLRFDVQIRCVFRPDVLPLVGDQVECTGRLEKVRAASLPGQPDYASYLASRGVLAEMAVFDPSEFALVKSEPGTIDRFRRVLEEGRQRVIAGFHRTLPPEEAGLLGAMLLGERTHLPAETRRLLVETGIYHITAVSGLHITAIALILIVAGKLAGLKRRQAAILAIPLLLAFQCLIGWRYPSLRATTMGVALMAGRWLRRDTDPLASLAMAALVLAFISPLSAFQPGFQLSFLICTGIVLGMNRFRELGFTEFAGRTRWPLQPVVLGAFVSMSAFLFGAPVIAWHFQTVSPISVIINPVASLFIVAIMAAGLIQAALIFILPSLSGIVGLVSATLLKVLLAIARFFHDFPGGHFVVSRPSLVTVAFIYLLLLCLLAGKRAFPITLGRVPLRRYQAALGVGVLFVWVSLLHPGQENLQIDFLSIGQGDCVVFHHPGGATLLSDGGPSYVTDGRPWPETPLARYLRAEGIQRIDVAIASHPQDDHIGGLIDVLENMPVTTVIDSGVREETSTSRRFESAIRASGARRINVVQGDRIEGLIPGVTLDFVYPAASALLNVENANEASVVTIVRYGEIDTLLTGDIGAALELDLADLGPVMDCEILKVAHHGSLYSSAEGFLEAVSPDISVICVGKNSYGHPHPVTVGRLRKYSPLVYRTDRDGTVRILTDGNHYRVSAFNNTEAYSN